MLEAGYPKRHILRIMDGLEGEALTKADQLLPKIQENGIFILNGDRGRGKTQIATYWAYRRKTDENPRSVGRYIKAHDLLVAIKSSFDGSDAQKKFADSLLKSCKTTGYLVIDECHELKGTDFERQTMTNLIDHRYDAMLTTVIITNEGDIDEQLGRSIWSRVQEDGGLINCDWKNYRAKN